MDKILNLSLAYPDFQLNQVIDPDQIDLNNAQITSKVNEIASKINTLVGENTGASHITVAPLAQFPDKKNVQDTIKAIVDTLVGVTGGQFLGANLNNGKVSIQEFLNMLNSAVTEHAQEISKIASRITALESSDVEHKLKLNTLDETTSNQANEIKGVKTRVTNIETENQLTNNKLSTVDDKNTYQDSQIANLNSTVTNHGSKITTLETKAGTAITDIATIKQDITRINTTNTNQEVVNAKQGFVNLKEKIEYGEINIGANVSTKSKVNFVVTDSNDTAFWEDKVAVASLQEHNIDPQAHGGSMTVHNVSSTAHEDIRRAISEKASTWAEIQNKPIVFTPIVHNHSKNQISDFTHTHAKAEISDFAHNHTKANITDFTHTHAKSEIGLGSVDNIKQMPITGGTFTGDVTMENGTSMKGHIVIPIGRPANATLGSIWLG